MSFGKLLLATVGALALTGFTKETVRTYDDFNRGTPAYEMNVESASLLVNGQPVDRNDAIFNDWPMLKKQIDELYFVDGGIETTEGNLELSVCEHLLVAVQLGQTPSVVWSRTGDFMPESIAYTRTSDLTPAMAVATFNLKECKTGTGQNPEQLCQTATVALGLKQIEDDNGQE